VLEPLLADPATGELVVIDDGSGDDTTHLVRRLAAADPRVTVLRREGVGAAAARQAGVEAASGEVLLFVDDDVVPEPGLVSGHLARHIAEPDEVVVVGYMPVRPPSTRRPGDAPRLLYSDDYEECCDSWERDPAMILNRFWAGNVSLRRDRCLEVPLPSPHAPIAYHEDEDFGLRLGASGVRGVFDRSLRAEHRYERPRPAFLLDAYRQGADRWHLRVAYPDLEQRLGWSIVPKPFPLSRHRTLEGLLVALALGTARVGGRLHLWRLESDGLRVARRLERRRGYCDAARGVRPVASR
jgi:glycosyltransferase involved in cell wall biosynthesis